MNPWRIVFHLLSAAALLFPIAPILAVIPLSFSSNSILSYPMPGLSLRWYESIASSSRWYVALANSMIIGISATAISVVLGTMASFGLARRSGPVAAAMRVLILSPMIVPIVLVAVALYLFLAPLQLTNTMTGMILAHTVIAVPFVVIPVLTAIEQLDGNMIRAAASCGARPWTAFRRVTVPSIAPSLASGALFAFAASFDDVVIALFVAGPNQRTLPREMYSSLRETISPELIAVATIMMIFSTALFLLMQNLQRRRRRMLQSAARS
ncbi:ABC transporter permease [Shinella sp. NM-101]|uniref:ABC transporter permease n=1 Tax=Shinella sp. NM-101 TaxID=2744455 RepID=UPI001F440A87|nr:ABC transporter permease [Shinella sp. NM-101]